MPKRISALVAVLASAACAQPVAPRRASDPVRYAVVSSTGRQVIRGWGMSLAWEANRIYGDQTFGPEIPDPAEQVRFMDLLYGDPASGPGLGLTVARYNIGGGSEPGGRGCDRAPKHGLSPSKAMQGYLSGRHGRYDWSRDASQRHMLDEARKRGATIIEAFSNSPPWWMTSSGCVAGAVRSGENNLRAAAVAVFTAYLATVALHFRAVGIRFDSISPVNEPDGHWWQAGNDQEGSFASLAMQQSIVQSLARRLKGRGIAVAGTEANDLDNMTAWLGEMDGHTLDALARVNVHQYQPGDATALGQRARALGKPVWASEVGCCFDRRTEFEGALFMADAIRQAFADLQAEVWCFWQPDWNVLDFPGGHPRQRKQFYAIAHFSRFMRPGSVILDSVGDGLLAALSPDRRTIALVAINSGPSAAVENIRLPWPVAPGSLIAAFRTTAATSDDMMPVVVRADAAGHLVDREPAGSLTSYVVDVPR